MSKKWFLQIKFNRVTYCCFTCKSLPSKLGKSVCGVSTGTKLATFGGHCYIFPLSIDSIRSIVTTRWYVDRVFEVKVSLWDVRFRYSSKWQATYFRLMLVKITYLPTWVNSLRALSSAQFPTRVPLP